MMARAAKILAGIVLLMALGAPGFSGSATAGAIGTGTFLEFSFSDAGTPATGCFPDDPAGGFCIPSSGTPTAFLDAPPWTFVGPTSGALLTVVDAFEIGDRFEIFDLGVSAGLTSVPAAGGDCGDDPVPCLADPGSSKGLFALGAGSHSITIVPVLSPFGGGSAYLRVNEAAGPAVPEPGSAVLLVTGLVWLALGAPRRLLARRDRSSTWAERKHHGCPPRHPSLAARLS